MADRKNKNTPKKFSKKDADLWRSVTKDVKRLPERDYEDGEEGEAVEEVRIKERTPSPRVKPETKQGTGKDVDKRTLERFRKGKMKIEATIDLHGFSQIQARPQLERFIMESYQRGRRCVLVITGKGLLDKPGVIKTKLPEWLAEGAFAGIVLRVSPAQIKDGGQGAAYVLLRRQR
jgi:DNA-nicking Smr family endonuclease